MKKNLLLLLILILWMPLASADIAVVSYNMGQLKKAGLDFVPCTQRRVAPQIKAMFQDPDSPIYRGENFVLLIQEAFTKKAFFALKRIVLEKSLHMFPENYSALKNNGQVIITDLVPRNPIFLPFSNDKLAEKGILFIELKLSEGEIIGVVNVHTGYSDHNSFRLEHLHHFEEIGTFISLHKISGRPLILGGDFNAGPDMSFKNELYNSSKIIWEDGLIPIMNDLDMRLISPVGHTWDDLKNSLVNKPTFTVRLTNYLFYGTTSWDQSSSTLDHIFGSNELEVIDSEVVFNQPAAYSCPKRSDNTGTPLSDHYGVLTLVRPRS